MMVENLYWVGYAGAAGVVDYPRAIIVVGFAIAGFMLNSRGAWDNAKGRFIK